MKRKILALLLVLAMIASVTPLVAYAEDGEPETHEHQYSEYSYSDAFHWQVCTVEDCYEIANSGTHTFDENNVCTVCGFQGAGEHEHVWESAWSTDGLGQHWHKCTICGDAAQFEDGSGLGFHDGCLNVACSICGEYNVMCPTNDDGICTICGFNYTTGEFGEIPKDSEVPGDEEDPDDTDIAGNGHSKEHPDHAYADENYDCQCDVCGYKDDYTHVFDWDEITKDENGHKSTCACGEIEVSGAHYDYNNDGACDWCGWGCKHPEIEWGRSEYGHTKFCAVCFELLSDYDEAHYDNDKDGVCDVCGYQMSTTASVGSDDGLDNVPKTYDLSAVVMGMAALAFAAALPVMKRFMF